MSHFLIDIDGVLADLTGQVCRVMTERHGTDLTSNDIDRFYCEEVFAERYGPEFAQHAKAVIREPGFFLNLPLKEPAVDLSILNRLGHTWQLCSSPVTTPTCKQEKLAWVTRYFGKEVSKTTMIIRDKSLADGDYLIDDRPSCMSHDKYKWPKKWKHVLVDSPYAHLSVGHCYVMRSMRPLAMVFLDSFVRSGVYESNRRTNSNQPDGNTDTVGPS